MDCGICSQNLGSLRQPLCISCARATLYQSRVHGVSALLDRERQHRRVEHVVSPPQEYSSAIISGLDLVELTESGKKLEHERHQDRIDAINDKVARIKEQHELLRRQIQDAQHGIAQTKGLHQRQREQVSKERQALTGRISSAMAPLQADIRRFQRRTTRIHDRTTRDRQILCRNAARVAELVQKRSVTARNGKAKEEYLINRLPLLDLRDLNIAHPEGLTTTLAATCRLVLTSCSYLGVRLPAEISLPYRESVHPVILSLQSSYQNDPDHAPSASQKSPSHSMLYSTGSLRQAQGRSKPKLRLLHLDRPLLRLAKEDPATYNLFIEGVALLAWNIAWLCRSQGGPDITSWEDACNIGKNLWRLLVEPTRPDHDPTISTKTAPVMIPTTDAPASENTGPPSQPVLSCPVLGEYSHDRKHMNLAGPQGLEWMRAWNAPSLARIIDGLKSHLLTEMSGAEWELLEEREWNEEREDEHAILVGGTSSRVAQTGTTGESRTRLGAMTVPDAGAVGDASGIDSTKGDRMENRSEAKGWTKVRERGAEGQV